ncbi:Tripartite tricarboxylate transporter TctB family protein [Neomoorella glycerini]|uniref:Tripartite tricarboxylate transporter TctB family protein n=1 Tax=Neomoorella glycerini TaxID=55779 RepID=A0A6I5ZWL6_9FIRM|nr:tripartite tricarboxylate transporter TctB family protein [Moorella glycerini]QGP94025.1 Tripartite tricarboxylate transporter TctB family protein [Moorella glycerini]
MRYGEMGISAGMAILAIIFYSLATFKQEINPVDPGPAFYPRLVSVLLFAFAVAQLILSWRKGEIKKENKKEAGKMLLYIIGTLAFSIIYILLFDATSYLLTTTFFLIALMLLGGVRNWWVLISAAAGYSLATYYLFGQVLKVPLP